MHDLEFQHLHVADGDTEQINEIAWSTDNVELTTVGIDIGSSTSHLMFARVHLQRLSAAHTAWSPMRAHGSGVAHTPAGQSAPAGHASTCSHRQLEPAG